MKHFFIATALLVSVSVQAQETYLNNMIANTSDLFGTARYVGMGGAMGALGADLSTISSNPAAIGLFKKSVASVSFGAIRQADDNIEGEKQTHASFDQLGFVVPFCDDSYGVNFAINYQKKNNLTHKFIADGTGYSLLNSIDGMGLAFAAYDYINPVVETAHNAGIYDIDAIGTLDACLINEDNADYEGNGFMRITTGNVHSFDLNLSGHCHNRVFWGLTVGIDVVDYKSEALYDEYWSDKGTGSNLSYSFNNTQRLTGTGYNVKAGVIFRPIEESAFRIGLAIETPTWYELRYKGYCEYVTDQRFPMYDGDARLTYKLETPWRVRLSLGHTIGTQIAIGAEYEYAAYGSTKMGYPDDDDYYAEDWGSTEYDRLMNGQTKDLIDGVHAVKLGFEYKPIPEFALRMGYNYYSSPCKSSGLSGLVLGNQLDQTLDSYASQFYTYTDYMLPGDVNIITLGAGYSGKHFFADLAYKCRLQKADFYPFTDYFSQQTPREINLDTHQIALTLGYRF